MEILEFVKEYAPLLGLAGGILSVIAALLKFYGPRKTPEMMQKEHDLEEVKRHQKVLRNALILVLKSGENNHNCKKHWRSIRKALPTYKPAEIRAALPEIATAGRSDQKLITYETWQLRPELR